MSRFSIDDVRETFTSDLSHYLGRLEATAKLLLAARPLTADQFPVLTDEGRPIFESIGNDAHAVLGTAGLVGADSLASTSRRLEELAIDGNQILRQMEALASRARTIADLFASGSAQMKAMMELELEKKGGDALKLAERWLEEAATVPPPTPTASSRPMLGAETPVPKVGAPPAPPAEEPIATAPAPEEAPESTEEFSFDDDSAASRSAPPAAKAARQVAAPAESGGGMVDELKAIFQQEAREYLVALQGHLIALSTQPDNLATAGHIERIYHTLKGASATVGLKDVSELAKELQERMERVVEGEVKVNSAFLEKLLSSTNQLLRTAGLPETSLVQSGQKQPSASGERHFFVEETRISCVEALKLAAQLATASADRVTEVRAGLGRLFHRLKGSALVVGEQNVAMEVAALQSMCEENTRAPSPDAVSQGVNRVAKMLGLNLDRGGTDSAVPPPSAAVSHAPVREAIKMQADPELWEAFNQECAEILESMEKAILSLEESDQPKKSLHEVMRLCHTLKGAINTIGLSPTGKELHRVEDFLEGLIESSILPPMKGVASFLLQVQSDVRKNLKTAPQGWVETSVGRLEARLASVLGRHQHSESSVVAHSEANAQHAEPGSSQGPDSSVLTTSDPSTRKFIRVSTDRLDMLMNLAGELVVSRSRLQSRVSVLRSIQQELAHNKRRLLDRVDQFREQHEFSGLLRSAEKRRQAFAPARTRVRGRKMAVNAPEAAVGGFTDLEMDKYDDINILARGLAEISNDFSEMYLQMSRELSAFNDDSEEFGGIVSGIQSEVTRSRMVPLETLFSRLRLPVRDAATREAKEVRVTTQGEDVHLDKTIADSLFQPMLHLVRNSVVHGVERPERRGSAGKTREGTITLVARQESGQIVLEVSDDGAGLDLAALHAQGLRRGLVSQDTPRTDPAVRDLIFVPGLTTTTVAGAVSGRGVGCDVVRRAIERLNGDIRVDTTPGRGTTFIIKLPVTLAITKALVVRQRKQIYAIPLSFAERISEVDNAEIVESMGSRRIKIEGEYMIVRDLGRLFGVTEENTATGPVVVLRMGDQRVAMQVEAVLGQEEIVVKELGDVLVGHPLFAGVTIRGTGELVLIVDVPGVMEATAGRRRETTSAASPVPGGVEEVAAQITQLPERPVALGSKQLRVLFADDSLSVRKVAEKTLSGLGADVTMAIDGLDAMGKLREGTYDMVFTDLEMPRMHGYELIRELRFIPQYKDLPIVVVSSRSGQKHQDQARQLGANDYITKPFTPETLEAALQKWGRRGGGGEA
jgi:chemosensory pili system protein ChpA (sensor histidine kinase/response regulator)